MGNTCSNEHQQSAEINQEISNVQTVNFKNKADTQVVQQQNDGLVQAQVETVKPEVQKVQSTKRVELKPLVVDNQNKILELSDDKKDFKLSKMDQFQLLQQFQTLQNLFVHLANQNLGDDGANQLGQSLSSISTVENLRLVLNWNNIGDLGAQQLFDSLKTLKNLKNLDLIISYNQISLAKKKQLGTILQDINGVNINSKGLVPYDVSNSIAEKSLEEIFPSNV